MKAKKKLYLPDAGNQEYITSIECIGADRFALTSFLIAAGTWIFEKWALNNGLTGDEVLTVSESGYSNDELSLQW